MRADILQVRLGDAIRRRRQELGHSQEGFADFVGMHRTYFGRIEQGRFNVTLKSLAKLAKAFDCSVWELIKEAETGK